MTVLGFSAPWNRKPLGVTLMRAQVCTTVIVSRVKVTSPGARATLVKGYLTSLHLCFSRCGMGQTVVLSS